MTKAKIINKTWRKAAGFAAVAAALVTLSGCSALSVGEEEFACSGMPGSVYCHSARDVYDKTNDGVVPSPVGKAEGAYNEDCKDCVRAEDINPALAVKEDEQSKFAVGVSAKNRRNAATNDEWIEVVDTKTGERKTIKKKTLEVHNDEVINNYVAPRLPNEPVPVRTPAQIMRIWVAPFVDVVGDLIAPGYVYTEIEPRRWIYPSDVAGANSKAFTPLKASETYGTVSHKSRDASVPAFNSLQKFKREYAVDSKVNF